MNQKIFFLACFLTVSFSNYSQIFDFSKSNPYQKVFVETDAFDFNYLQQLKEALPKIKTDTIKFSVLNDLAYYWHTRNLDSAYVYTEKGIKFTSEGKNEMWYGRFLITKGAVLLRQEKLDSAFYVLEEAKKRVPQKDLAFLNTQLGYVFERRGQLDKAADYAIISLNLGKRLNDKKAMALAYSDLSNLFWKQSKYEKGLEYGLKSIDLFEEWGIEDLDYDFTLYIVGNNYLALNDLENARIYYEQSIAIGERYGFYNNLSDVYISLVDLYSSIKEYNKGEIAGQNAIKYADSLENAFMSMRSYLSVGKLENNKGDFDSAIFNLKKSIEVATEDFGDDFYLSLAYNALGKAYANSGNFEKAYEAFSVYDTLKGKVFTAEADQRISLLQTEFDVEQKENTINLQDSKLKVQETKQNLILLVSSLLLLLLGILYVTFRNNQKKNKLLEKQNLEKEFLLKEIHHRVKNNLEVVSSLLALQSAQMEDPNVADAILESQNRVQSMSMIHQKLYQGENLASIEMLGYFRELGSHILDSFAMKDRIVVVYDLKPIHFDVDIAIPLGLIVNELLTNALKYAFPNERKGTITIDLKPIEENKMRLKIIDDGIGQPENQIVKGTGFGTQLVQLLATQLEAKIYEETSQGTKVTLEFELE